MNFLRVWITMSERPYFRFFMGDYLADTGHLDADEHGAYLMLMVDYYWHREGPLADEKNLQKITKLSRHKWKNISPVVLRFFEIRDGRLWQKRIEKELQHKGKKTKQAQDAANARWNADAMRTQCGGDAKGMLCQSLESEIKPKTPLSSCEQPDDHDLSEEIPIEGNPDLDAAEQEGEPDPKDRANWKALFVFWQEQHGHQKAKFTKEREAKLRARLREGYSLDECAAAIRGVKRSKFHMGDNPDGKKWDEWNLIFRSGAYLEKFRDLDLEGVKA